MAVFKYKAMDKLGKKIEATFVADSKEQVLNMIKTNNYYPLNIEEVMEGNTLDLSYYFSKVKTKEISIFCRQFYTMLNAGATILNCLEVLKTQTQNVKLKRALIDVYEQVQKGLTLSEAMKKQNEVFPELLINMIESGELSGNLDVIMSRMSAHFEKENKINNKVKGAMIYPAILGGLATIIVAFLLLFIMPTFVDMFQSSGVKLPTPTLILLAMSKGLQTYWYLVFGGVVGMIFGIKVYGKTEKGRFLFDTMKLKIPGLKGLHQKIAVSRFTRTLSTILASGIPLVNALEVVAKVCGNKVIEMKILEVREKTMRGVGLAEPIKEAKVFPMMLYSMIHIGEESGTLDEILDKTADFYDEELETALHAFTTALEPLMLIIMGFLIGGIVLAMMMPMFDMVKAVN